MSMDLHTLAAVLALALGLQTWVLWIQYRARRNARDHFEAIFRTSPDAVLISRTGDGRVVEFNAGFAALSGLDREAVLGRRIEELELWGEPEARARVADLMARREPVHHLELPCRNRDGRRLICLVSAEPVTLDGQPHLLTVASDITDQKRAEETLKDSNLFLSDMFENNGALIYVKDLAGCYQSVNRKWEEVTGLSREAVLHRRDADLFQAEAGQAWNRRDPEVVSLAQVLEEEEVLAGPQGPRYFLSVKFPLRNADHSVRGLCGISTEITQRKEDERRIRELAAQLEQERNDARTSAITDELTQLANRRQFDRVLGTEFYRLKRSGAPLALIMIDVDHFKDFNDRFGHPAGDECLRRIGGVLKLTVGRGADLAARYGGEEFVVILPETGLEGAELLAERLRAAVQQLAIPHPDNQADGWVTISLGVASRGVVAMAGPDELVELADVALYQAKRTGRNRVASAAPDGNRPDLVRLVWREAIQCGHPVIDAQHRRLFERANALLSALLEGRPKPECTQRIHEVLEEIMNHFRDEEGILRDAHYPGVVEHTRCHTELLAKAVALAGKFERGQLQLGELFTYLAYEVVAQHILQEDRAFFAYL
jgi:diguanylate cyclase (GGDEF)-like protein/hemerythrin-like metal-binding protein/PAS domain S-box-containing protein